MTRYYSQHGEDFLLSEICRDIPVGFFVEVGCIDGRRFSNTLTFEERGWRGLCVEAHGAYIEMIKKNRPNSIVCHCAAGEKDEEGVVFYANARGSLSTLDRSMEAHFKEAYGTYFTGFEEQRVTKHRLSTLFHRYNIHDIDILSVDVEGCEVDVLKGIDFKKVRPRIMVIELENDDHERSVDQIVIPGGYVKSVKVGSNRFYLSEAGLARHIKKGLYRVPLTHTTHPLDKGPDREMVVELDMRGRMGFPVELCRTEAIMRRAGKVIKGIRARFRK